MKTKTLKTRTKKAKNTRKPKFDRKYNSTLVEKLICYVMHNGKKTKAMKIVYRSFVIIEKAKKSDPLPLFEKAIANAGPELELKSRRLGGNNYQVPFVVAPPKKIIFALRWIVGFARKRNLHTMEENLAQEIMNAADGVGDTIKKKDDLHKSARANWAFAHYRW